MDLSFHSMLTYFSILDSSFFGVTTTPVARTRLHLWGLSPPMPARRAPDVQESLANSGRRLANGHALPCAWPAGPASRGEFHPSLDTFGNFENHNLRGAMSTLHFTIISNVRPALRGFPAALSGPPCWGRSSHARAERTPCSVTVLAAWPGLVDPRARFGKVSPRRPLRNKSGRQKRTRASVPVAPAESERLAVHSWHS